MKYPMSPFKDLIEQASKPKIHFKGHEVLSLSHIGLINVKSVFFRGLKYSQGKPDHILVEIELADSSSMALEEGISVDDPVIFHKQLNHILTQEGFNGCLHLNVFKARIVDKKDTEKSTEVDMENNEKSRYRKDGNEDVEVYTSVKPYYTFKSLILPEKTMNALEEAIGIFSVYDQVFIEWGFSEIEPFPKCALNFYGPPGVGKTLSAHALADRLNKRIIVASYADIESKYHGDGPKNVQAIFDTAEKEEAVLFIDEADSLLSRRLTNVTQGSEQAINSMRSQLLICLEQFKGIVIFSTNLAQNYDKAFETRIRHIAFELPDQSCRKTLWELHIPSQVPSRGNIDFHSLSLIDDICGRDIKNASIHSAISAALNQTVLTTDLLIEQINQIIDARIKDTSTKAEDANPELKDKIFKALKKRRELDAEQNVMSQEDQTDKT